MSIRNVLMYGYGDLGKKKVIEYKKTKKGKKKIVKLVARKPLYMNPVNPFGYGRR